MTNWDHRPWYPYGYDESQIGEGGHNATDNCVPTSFTLAVMALDGPDINPQDITTAEYGGSYHGPESFQPTIDYLNAHWNLPTLTIDNPNDTLTWIDSYGQQQFPIICTFHCDSNANIVGYETGILHCSVVVAHVDQSVYVKNVWVDNLVALSESAFRNSVSGSDAGWCVAFNHQLSLRGNKFVAGISSRAVGIYPTRSGNGYYVVEENGGLWPYGDAAAYTDGSGKANPVGRAANSIVGFAITPSGNGYYFLESNGGVWPFGDAKGIGAPVA